MEKDVCGSAGFTHPKLHRTCCRRLSQMNLVEHDCPVALCHNSPRKQVDSPGGWQLPHFLRTKPSKVLTSSRFRNSPCFTVNSVQLTWVICKLNPRQKQFSNGRARPDFMSSSRWTRSATAEFLAQVGNRILAGQNEGTWHAGQVQRLSSAGSSS